MPKYGREDDLVVALQEAVKLMSCGRFEELARCNLDEAAAERVTKVADVFVRWLRQVKTVKLTLVRIEEMDDPSVFTTPGEGETVTTIDSSQQARYVIDAADDRGWAVDVSLSVEATPAGIVEVTLLEATSGTASGKDELVVKALSPGSALVTVFDAANAETVFGSDSVDVVPGGVATVILSTPTIEEQPAPEPAPEPEPTPEP